MTYLMFIHDLDENDNLHGNKESAYSKYMDDAIFKIPTPLMLSKVVDALDEIYAQMSALKDTDVRGDVYEYLLSKIASAGVNGQLKEKFVSRNVECITEKGLENSSAKLFPENTVLIAMYGATIGACSILPYAATTNQACAAFLPCEAVIPSYLYNFLTSKKEQFVRDGVGGAQPNISAGYLKKVQLNVLPLKRQSEIVAVLDKVSDLIDKRRQQLETLDTLVKSQFIEMFGDPLTNPKEWEKRQLQELVSKDCSISYGIVKTGDDVPDGIPVFRPVDIVGKTPALDEMKRTTKEISDQYKRTLLKGNELLITVRANIADTCIIGEEFSGCNVGRGIVPIRTDEEKINLEFLKAQIDFDSLNQYIKSKAKGITLIQLNMEDLRLIEFVVPPMELQNQFVCIKQQTDKLKLAIRQSLEILETLKKSLMQQFF